MDPKSSRPRGGRPAAAARMARKAGFEPATPGSEDRRSGPLSYSRGKKWIRRPGLRRALPATNGVRRCLRLDGMESGWPGWIRTISLPGNNRLLYSLSYGPTSATAQRRKWGGRRDSNPQHPDPQSGVLPLNYSHRLSGSGRAPWCCPRCLADPNGADCCLPRARGGGDARARTAIAAMSARNPALDDDPGKRSGRGAAAGPQEMDTRPGLAPGKSGVAARRLDDCGMRVVVKTSARGELHSQGSPLLRRCGLLFPLSHEPMKKKIPRPELHRLGPRYERGA